MTKHYVRSIDEILNITEEAIGAHKSDIIMIVDYRQTGWFIRMKKLDNCFHSTSRVLSTKKNELRTCAVPRSEKGFNLFFYFGVP